MGFLPIMALVGASCTAFTGLDQLSIDAEPDESDASAPSSSDATAPSVDATPDTRAGGSVPDAGPDAPSDAAADADAAVVACTDPALILYLRLEEGSGALVSDCSPTKASGQITNGTWTDGAFGKGVSFNAGFIGLGNLTAFQLTGGFTVSVWARPAAIASGPNSSYLIGKTTQTGVDGWRLAFRDGSKLDFSVTGPLTNGSQGIVNGGAIGLNVWVHAAATYSGGQATLYVNGTPVAQKNDLPNAASSSPAELRVGARGDSDPSGTHFNGTLDEVRVYSRVLTQSEIQALATAP